MRSLLIVRSSRLRLAALALAAPLALAGCAGPEAPAPEVTGTASSYGSLEELRDAFIAAGGECPAWERIDSGDFDADGGRCDDSTVITVFRDREQLAEVVERAKALATATHLLVGTDWLINTPEPHRYVDALGGTVVTG